MAVRELLSREPSKTLAWLEDNRADHFNDFIREEFNRVEYTLATETEPAKIYRAQGELKALGTIIEMRASIRSYLHDVSTGKRERLKEIQPNGVVQR